VRALTMGRFTRLVPTAGEGWCAERAPGSALFPLASLDPGERDEIALALRLGLLEVLAPALRLPVLVGPELPAWTGDRARVLGRAFRRLGGVTQVVQLCAGEDFAAQSDAVHRLSA
jgi:hypothetical protein